MQEEAKAPTGAEGSASHKGLPQNRKDKEEAMMRELKELKQVQQRRILHVTYAYVR